MTATGAPAASIMVRFLLKPDLPRTSNRVVPVSSAIESPAPSDLVRVIR